MPLAKQWCSSLLCNPPSQRAKSMKFKDGYMVSSGEPTRTYIDSAVRHVLLRQGVLGIKVSGLRCDAYRSGKGVWRR